MNCVRTTTTRCFVVGPSHVGNNAFPSASTRFGRRRRSSRTRRQDETGKSKTTMNKCQISSDPRIQTLLGNGLRARREFSGSGYCVRARVCTRCDRYPTPEVLYPCMRVCWDAREKLRPARACGTTRPRVSELIGPSRMTCLCRACG